MAKIPNLMEQSDSTIRHSLFDIIHSKGGFFGAWNLDIICYLSFGAWNFLNSPMLRCPTLHYCKKTVCLKKSGMRKFILKIGVAIPAKIERNVIQICKSS